MPKRSSKPPKDANQAAAWIAVAATGKTLPQMQGKNLAAVALGRLGGLKGGKARATKLSPKQRVRIARKAAFARWKKSTVS